MNTAKTILLVDDDEDDRVIFMEALRDADTPINCYYARNGEEALKMLETKKDNLPDFIFLDLNMPRLNGKQCLAEIKKMQSLLHIPVIIYTTSKLEDDVRETRSLGASFFLTKPNLFGDLQKAILHIVSGKQPQHEDSLKQIVELL